jgi:hypothetical protein
MPYFIILPLYVALLATMLAVGVGFRFTRFRQLSPYAFGVAFGSLLGLVGANALLVSLLLLFRQLPMPSWPITQALGLATIIFMGPFVASAIGVAASAAVGIYGVWRMTLRRS